MARKLNLKTFERQVRIRQLVAEDHEAIADLQRRCFPKMKPWNTEQFASMIERFPEGQLAVEYHGKLVASSCSLMLDFDAYSEWHDWMLVSDSGYIRNHNPQGDTLYGIEIMVAPDFRGMRLARRLYDARKDICRHHNLMRIVIGGRIPGYGAYRQELTAEEYVERVVRKEIFDPVLTAQLANGFVLRGLIPDYLPSDEDSAGYATFLEWTNPHFVPGAKRRLSPVQMVRVCTVQYQMRSIGSFEEFGQQATFFIDVASDYHCDFVVFPELFTTQLLSFTRAPRPGMAARKLAEFTPRYLELFSGLAVKYNINIIGGSQFTVEEDDRLYNVAYLFRRDGTLGKQYKIHITPSERRWWGVAPGSGLQVFDTDRGKIAILVCYDIEFPELARVAAKKGAQLLFVPFNTDERHGYLRVRVCAQARCIENHVYVVTSGCVGNLPFVDNADVHYAQSGIFTPADLAFSRDGIAAECTPNIETVVMHDIDIELLRRHRYSGTVQNWNDRRRDLYRIVFQDGSETVEV
jgi:predicted amidohydrolase/ribosomal protein S18 acetylase RimI-like enzyme